jgi:branched-chain amino acid transport system permease protein
VNFQFLLATAFASLIVARLRSPGRAVIAALAIGVATALVQKYAPPSSSLAQEAIPAVPFAVVFVFIIVQFRRVGQIAGDDGGPGADHLSAADHLLRQPLALATTVTSAVSHESTRLIRALKSARRATPLSVLLLALALLPVLLSAYWAAVLADGFAFGIVFLSFTLLTGEGGFISLAQAAFAGIGSVALGQLASAAGLPAIPSLLLAGLAGLAVGLLLGLLTVRLGTLYVALITLTFGLLMDNVVFALPRFVNDGSGVVVARPEFFSGDRAFAYLALGVFVIAALFVFNIKRSTTGLAIVAARWSPTASSTLGLSTTMIRVLLVGVASAIAATGGAILTWFQQEALPSYFVTPNGLLWLAVAVAIGVRSIPAALFAGVSLTVFPALVANYLPTWWTPVPTLLFGLAAIGMVRQPDGLAGDISALYRRVTRRAGRVGIGPSSAPRPDGEVREQPASSHGRSVDASSLPQ